MRKDFIPTCVCVCVYYFISFSPYVASSQHFCHLRKCCLDTYHVCWNLIAYCFQTPANNIRSYLNDSVFKRPKGWCFYFMDGQPGTLFFHVKAPCHYWKLMKIATPDLAENPWGRFQVGETFLTCISYVSMQLRIRLAVSFIYRYTIH